MRHRSFSVRELAAEAHLDLDESLVRLWDAGLGAVNDPASRIPTREMNRARRALGIPTRRELSSTGYWTKLLGLSELQFLTLLQTLHITMRVGCNKLPKGAIAKLRTESRKRGIEVTALTPVPPPLAQLVIAAPPLEWPTIGHAAAVRHLSREQVVDIHNALARDFAETPDPISPAGIRNHSLLESAVFRQHTSLGETRKYPTPEMAAAALLHSLVLDHAFHNGNKRTATVCMVVALDENGLILTCNDDELFKLVLLVAQHHIVHAGGDELADREVLEIANWIAKYTRWVDRRARPIAWLKLKRILASFGCVIECANGNRLNISRTVKRSALWILSRRKTLKTQASYAGDGREVSRATVAQIRRELELDELHGVDSRAFYDDEPAAVSDFIVRYRKILRRLARC